MSSLAAYPGMMRRARERLGLRECRAVWLLGLTVAFGSHTTTSSYTACYSKTNGAVRLIKEPGLPKGCPSGYTKFTFPDTAATEARATFTTDGPKPLGDHGDNSTMGGPHW